MFAKMQAEKAAYERIILEKDRQIAVLKDIIRKLEESKSKDLATLKDEAFKIKEAQIELLESERNAEKLSFLGVIEQFKAQVRNFEASLEARLEENKKLTAWNLEKTKEIELLKENKRELQTLLEDYKPLKGEKDLNDAILKASKEKALMESQIRTLRSTIENQKAQIDALFQRLGEKEPEK